MVFGIMMFPLGGEGGEEHLLDEIGSRVTVSFVSGPVISVVGLQVVFGSSVRGGSLVRRRDVLSGMRINWFVQDTCMGQLCRQVVRL